MFWVLIQPFAYLTIRHPHKWLVDWAVPVALTILSVAITWISTHFDRIGDEHGLLERLFIFVGLLPGFFIAALAAIATFNKPDIDDVMPEPSPRLGIQIHGQKSIIRLTRRRFLALLFSFLCAESIALTVGLSFILADGPSLVAHITMPCLHLAAKVATFAILLLMFWQMIAATFFGLYYLGHRLLMSDK